MKNLKLSIFFVSVFQLSCMVSSHTSLRSGSVGVDDIVAPASPQLDFSAMTLDKTHFGIDSTPEIVWLSSSDEGGAGLSHYEIAVGTQDNPTSVLDWTNVGLENRAQLKVPRLSRGKDYQLSILAVDQAGNKSTPVVSPAWKAEPRVVDYENLVTNLNLNEAATYYRKNEVNEEFLGGNFVSYHVQKIGCAAVVDQNGAIDTQFYTSESRKSCQGVIKKALAQTIGSDQYVVVAGNISVLNGESVSSSARLYRTLANGNLDTAFQTQIGTGFSGGDINDILITANNKILVGGSFTSFKGSAVGRIVRLNSDGSLDSTFNVGVGFDNVVNSMYELSSGKIVLGGKFSKLNNVTISRLITLLNPDGSVDSTFASNAGVGFNQVDSMGNVAYVGVNSAGQILVTGRFTQYPGASTSTVCTALLNVDGTIDNSFVTNISSRFFSVNITRAMELPDSSYLFAGAINQYSGQTMGALLKVNKTTGNIDTTFKNNTNSDMNGATLGNIIVSGNKLILAGNFNSINQNSAYKYLARINLDGTIDTSFAYTAAMGFKAAPAYAFLNSDNKFYVTGLLQYYGGTPSPRFLKLNADNTINTAFTAYISTLLQNFSVSIFFRAANSRFFFQGFDGTTSTYTTSCVSDSGTACIASAFEKTLVTARGVFSDGSALVVKENPNDDDIQIASRVGLDNLENQAFETQVLTLGYSSDHYYDYMAFKDKIYVIGEFSNLNSRVNQNLFRMNADGTPDELFNAEIDAGLSVESGYLSTQNVFLNSKDDVFVSFYKSSGTAKFNQTNLPNNINFIKLSKDGKLDLAYLNNAAAKLETETVVGIKFLPDDRAIIYGRLTVNGVFRSVARLQADGSVDMAFDQMTQFGGTGVDDVFFDNDDNIVILTVGALTFKGQSLSDRYFYKFSAK